MEYINLNSTKIQAARIILGCMRIANMSLKDIDVWVKTSMDLGMNFFDHANIYAKGRSEELFSAAIGMNSSLREKMIIQSKCGINQIDGDFDFSKDHILSSVDESLNRLKTDYLDILLLHRPDTLFELQEVAEAFDLLETKGKVRHFGVSNQNPMQIQLLQMGIKQPLIINQMQLSLAFTPTFDQGFNNNMQLDASIMRDGSIIEYSRIHNMTIQAWSPFQYGFFEGSFIGSDKYIELNKVLHRIAGEKNITPEAIAIAWILRHPAKMQAVLGTTNIERIKGIAKATDIELSRKEWYELYKAAGNTLP